jgi:hypothetical protein
VLPASVVDDAAERSTMCRWTDHAPLDDVGRRTVNADRPLGPDVEPNSLEL